VNERAKALAGVATDLSGERSDRRRIGEIAGE
jgi:hypothetical protein